MVSSLFPPGGGRAPAPKVLGQSLHLRLTAGWDRCTRSAAREKITRFHHVDKGFEKS